MVISIIMIHERHLSEQHAKPYCKETKKHIHDASDSSSITVTYRELPTSCLR